MWILHPLSSPPAPSRILNTPPVTQADSNIRLEVEGAENLEDVILEVHIVR